MDAGLRGLQHMKFERTGKFAACILFAIATAATIVTLVWFRQLGKLGIALGIGGAFFFAQWGWNMWHKDLNQQDRWIK